MVVQMFFFQQEIKLKFLCKPATASFFVHTNKPTKGGKQSNVFATYF